MRPTGPPELTFFLSRKRDDMTALLASKGQQFWMRSNVGLLAVQFHGPPAQVAAQVAAGWCNAYFRGSSHFLIAQSRFLIATMGTMGFEPTVSSPVTSQIILQLIQRVLLFEVMPQRHEQLRSVSDAILVESFVNLVHDRGSDGFTTMGSVRK